MSVFWIMVYKVFSLTISIDYEKDCLQLGLAIHIFDIYLYKEIYAQKYIFTVLFQIYHFSFVFLTQPFFFLVKFSTDAERNEATEQIVWKESNDVSYIYINTQTSDSRILEEKSEISMTKTGRTD